MYPRIKTIISPKRFPPGSPFQSPNRQTPHQPPILGQRVLPVKPHPLPSDVTRPLIFSAPPPPPPVGPTCHTPPRKKISGRRAEIFLPPTKPRGCHVEKYHHVGVKARAVGPTSPTWTLLPPSPLRRPDEPPPPPPLRSVVALDYISRRRLWSLPPPGRQGEIVAGSFCSSGFSLLTVSCSESRLFIYFLKKKRRKYLLVSWFVCGLFTCSPLICLCSNPGPCDFFVRGGVQFGEIWIPGLIVFFNFCLVLSCFLGDFVMGDVSLNPPINAEPLTKVNDRIYLYQIYWLGVSILSVCVVSCRLQ